MVNGKSVPRKDLLPALLNTNAASEIYYDPSHSAGFGGVERLARASDTKNLHKLRKWLSSQRTYTLHKGARKRYNTRPYKVGGIDFLWQADLWDMQQIK